MGRSIVAALIDLGAIIALVTQPAGDSMWSQIATIAFMSTTAILVGLTRLPRK